jgi:hypothetical protein
MLSPFLKMPPGSKVGFFYLFGNDKVTMQSDMKYIFQKYVLPGPGILAGFEPRAF